MNSEEIKTLKTNPNRGGGKTYFISGRHCNERRKAVNSRVNWIRLSCSTAEIPAARTPQSTTNYISQIHSVPTLTALNLPHTHGPTTLPVSKDYNQVSRLHAHRGLWHPGKIHLWASELSLVFGHNIPNMLGFQFSSGHSSTTNFMELRPSWEAASCAATL
jgi:hypothetical protein